MHLEHGVDSERKGIVVTVLMIAQQHTRHIVFRSAVRKGLRNVLVASDLKAPTVRSSC